MDSYKLRNFFFTGMHDVDNVFVSDKSMMIVQLDYEFDALSENGKASYTRCVGWLPVYVADKVGQSEFTVNDELLKGPGKTVTGAKMIEIGRGLGNVVKVAMKINLSRAASL